MKEHWLWYVHRIRKQSDMVKYCKLSVQRISFTIYAVYNAAMTEEILQVKISYMQLLL